MSVFILSIYVVLVAQVLLWIFPTNFLRCMGWMCICSVICGVRFSQDMI